MKVTLLNKKKDCNAYGLTFDVNGVCDCDKKVAQSLLDTGVIVEVKTTKAVKK